MNDCADFKKHADDAPASMHATNEQSAGNPLLRARIATTEAATHFLPGISIAIAQDAQHPDAVVENVLACGALGLAMRVALPKLAAARLLISGIFAWKASRDTAASLIDTYKKVCCSQNLNTTTSEGDELGIALGRFAVDSAIGIAAGSTSQKIAENALLAGLGHRGYLRFEYDKSALCSPVAKLVHLPAENIGVSLNKLSHIFPASCNVQLSLDEKLNRICNAGRSLSTQIENERFYHYGPPGRFGLHIGFSNYLDQVLKRVQDSSDMANTIGKQLESENNEFSAGNMSKLAVVIRSCMSSYSNKKVQLLDAKEQLKAPIFSVSDSTRFGALLSYKFLHSSKQLCDLINNVKTQTQLNSLLYILDLHAKSAIQDELKLANVGHLNALAKELHKSFIDGIRKSGISNHVLLGSSPSRVAITNDQGYVNFTIASIPGVIDRPVTVFPRNQTDLESVLAGINRHEMAGHDYLWGNLNGFADELRETVLPSTIKQAIKKVGIKDRNIEVPGLGVMKKSAFLLKVLQAQANENISDLAGTASGGADTALGLGLLLQSLRRDYKLETGSFISSQFDDFIESHGIDRCRIKCCAEQMRQLAPLNAEVLKQARALDVYAANVSRPGRYYIWANADNGGCVSIPIKEWDALIPHIVRAQLTTPLKSLEGKRLKDILPDMGQAVLKIEALASIMQHDLTSGKDILSSAFSTKQYSIGEVYAAGLRAWMGMTAQGIDPEKSLAQISRLSNKLCDLYLKKFR